MTGRYVVIIIDGDAVDLCEPYTSSLRYDDLKWEEAVELSGLVTEATRQAQRSLSPAISTLREIARDTGETATARISAARSLLEYGLKLTEVSDILDRLDALEESLGGEDHA